MATGSELISEARLRLGAPFRHHFKPVNLCEGGKTTQASCMERGMDPSGYDCSGLVIASICSVLDLSPQQWPPTFRHTQQLASLAIHDLGEPGDIRVYTSQNHRIHIGIATTSQEAIHASGVTQIVEEGIVTDKYGPFASIQAIPLEHLYQIAARTV